MRLICWWLGDSSYKGPVIQEVFTWHEIIIENANKISVRNVTFILINTLRPRQNGRHFADEPFKRIFLNENVWISLKISLKFVPRVPINNIPALVPIMAWRRSGGKPLSEPVMVSLLTHICITRPQWVKASINENSKAPHYWSFVRLIFWWLGDSSHKGPVIQEVFTWYGIIMENANKISVRNATFILINSLKPSDAYMSR